MIEFVNWCSLLCTGTEAIGDITIEYPDGGSLTLPVCQECLESVQNDQALALALQPAAVLDLDPDDEASRLIPRE